jgi:hypothetical protein
MVRATMEKGVKPAPEAINSEKIRTETEKSIAIYATAGTAIINRRLRELDEEWDVERALETNASAVSLLGIFLGAMLSRGWLLLPAAVVAFLLQHAVQGWCPPLVLFRKLGFRTRAEIDRERYAMKILRGDFQNMPRPDEDYAANAERILDAEEM